ncbi:MAG: hypothetical protein D6766_12055, partial [Verrucomicrobia bacterium]
PGSGGWSQNDIFPMLNDDGTRKVVHLGGTVTLRWQMDNGDQDYLLLVPVGGVVAPAMLNIALQDGQVVITWEGGGTLESADAVTGPWAEVPGAASPYTTAPTDAAKFYRVVR